MLRRLSTLLSAVSLVLCVAVLVLWCWCDGASYELDYTTTSAQYGCFSVGGVVYTGRYSDRARPEWLRPGLGYRVDHRESMGLYSFLVVKKHGREWNGFGVANADLP